MGYQKDIKCKNEEEFFDLLVSMYSLLYVPRQYWLTKQEKKFFIQCILIYRYGTNLISREAVKLLELKMNFPTKNRGVYIYRTILVEKCWLERTKNTLEIPQYFKSDFRTDPEVATFTSTILFPGNQSESKVPINKSFNQVQY